MISKVIFIALVALIAQALAGPEYCPDPSTAKEEVYNGIVHEDKPLYGRVSKDVILKTADEKILTCILVTGISKEGDVTLKLLSTIKNGIDVSVEVYT